MRRLCLLLALLCAACSKPAPADRPIILATTTSFQDTGLLEMLVARFREAGGPPVKAIAVGTGEALAMGGRGDADVLVVHAPKAEDEFMAKGLGRERKALWHNDFVLVGPAADPAGAKGLKSAAEALKKIGAAGALFVSRADQSGTHKKELELVKAAGLADWKPMATGQGMAETLRIASEKQGYTLADRGSWLATKISLSLEVAVEGDPPLMNPYHVIEVDPKVNARVNADGAHRFAQFLVTPETQRFVAGFGLAKYGQALFVPDALEGAREPGR
jgi:tungstate transport system substrate-binding protein